MSDDLCKPENPALPINGNGWWWHLGWSGADTGYDSFTVGRHDIPRPLGPCTAIPGQYAAGGIALKRQPVTFICGDWTSGNQFCKKQVSS